MAKKCMIRRQKRRTKLSKQFKDVRAALRKIMQDPEASWEEKEQAQKKLQQLPRDSAYCRTRHICRITGRSKGVYRKFKISRIKLRELAMFGFLPGIRKASW